MCVQIVRNKDHYYYIQNVVVSTIREFIITTVNTRI